MSDMPNCPKCDSEYTYNDGSLFVCPGCSHEWSDSSSIEKEKIFRDANGNILVDGDSVILIRDLKVKGSSNPIKQGTLVKDIQLIEDAVDGHDISCRIQGFGNMYLKSEVVKKS